MPNKASVISASVLLAAAAIAIPNIKTLEGYAAPYHDDGGVATDCWGNTTNVVIGVQRSETECEALINGAAKVLAQEIGDSLTQPASPVTLSAFISFSYNVGFPAFRKSTVLAKWNKGEFPAACAQLLRWVYIGNTYSQGLYNRRKLEYAQCMRGIQ